jgi:hypothetical protein
MQNGVETLLELGAVVDSGAETNVAIRLSNLALTFRNTQKWLRPTDHHLN